MAGGKAGARVKAVLVGTVRINAIPHQVLHFLAGLYILRPAQPRNKGHNLNEIAYFNWECLLKDYPEAEKISG
jgi:hypothetical protein